MRISDVQHINKQHYSKNRYNPSKFIGNAKKSNILVYIFFAAFTANNNFKIWQVATYEWNINPKHVFESKFTLSITM